MNETNLPELVRPKIMLMVTDCLVPKAEGVKEEPMSWVVTGAHPFIEAAQVVAIFVDGAGIDVYSVRRDETGDVECMRDHIPLSRVRVFRESMPFDTFENEMKLAEDDDEDEDDDGGENDEVAPVTSLVSPMVQPDGQTATQPEPAS